MRVVRATEDFPTPAFRLVCGWLASGLCAYAAASVVGLWDASHDGYFAVLAATALVAGAVPVRWGRTPGRLVLSVLAAAALVVVGFAAELVFFVFTTTWE